MRVRQYAAIAVLLVTVTLMGCRQEKPDPRAYPGSQEGSLEHWLKTYHLQLPQCAAESVRFQRYSQWQSDSLLLYFTGEAKCIDEFLSLNGMLEEKKTEANALPFRHLAGSNWGWPTDTSRRFTVVNHWIGDSSVHAEVAVDFSASPHALYLVAGIE